MGERNLFSDFASTSKLWMLFIILSTTGLACARAPGYVGAEANLWGAFRMVNQGELGAGIVELPAPVRERHCYRVILAADGTTPPQLRYRGAIDADSVGFPIQAIEQRYTGEAGGSLAVFGFCSQGTGTIQLMANLPVAGYAALLEAPFSALDPSHGPDVTLVGQWLIQQQRQSASRQAQAEQQRLTDLADRFALDATPELQRRISQIIGEQGRYETNILDDIKGNENLQEAMILDPGRCYIFAALGHQSTEIRSQLSFSRIRNAADRVDVNGAIMYTVCTAPSGPIQEVSYVVQARVPQGAPHPPIFIARVAHRNPTPVEARAADEEWIRNDPEGQTGQ